MKRLRDDDVPDDVRERSVQSDDQLGSMEKEFRIHGANDQDLCRISTEIPTIIKWIFSVEESTIDSVRIDADGAVVACNARIPKGILKLQANARQSNQHSQIVSYGQQRGND